MTRLDAMALLLRVNIRIARNESLGGWPTGVVQDSLHLTANLRRWVAREHFDEVGRRP
jgi:hypothetical protein